MLAGWVLLPSLFLVQGAAFIAASSQTHDEAAHLAAGYSYLTRRDFRLNPEHPPLIKELAALPVLLWYRLPFEPRARDWNSPHLGQWLIGRWFLYDSGLPADRILALARVPNLLLGAALVGLIGWWAFRRWGPGAALLGLALAAIEPNLIANASIITTDLGIAVFGFLALYLLWEYAARPSWPCLVGIGVAVGLAVASKHSAPMLLGILGLVGVAHVVSGGRLALPGAPRGAGSSDAITGPGLPTRLAAALVSALLVMTVAALVLAATYFFQGFSVWWQGMVQVMNHHAEGHKAFFLGEYSQDGWWSYFLVAFLIKTPLGALALVLASLVLWRAGEPLGRRDVVFLLLPVVLVLASTLGARINIGLRHILFVYPPLFVLASRLATLRLRPRWALAALLAIPLAFTAGSVWRVAPHYLAYFNEAVGGPGEGYRYLSDSNIDWGQDLKGLKAFVDREGLPGIYLAYFGGVPPGAYGIPFQPAPFFVCEHPCSLQVLPPWLRRELLAVSVMNLHGLILWRNDLYHWLYSRRPVAKIGYSIFVYDITGDADAHLRLARLYLEEGSPHLAAAEFWRAAQ
jgi:hypothetical protein